MSRPDPAELSVSATPVHLELAARARAAPDAAALLSLGGAPLTYRDLLSAVDDALASFRRMGVTPDDRIALILPQGCELALAIVAAVCGAVAAPLDPDLTLAEYLASLSMLAPRAVVVGAGERTAARAAAAELGIAVIELAPVGDTPAGSFHLSELPSRRPAGSGRGNARRCTRVAAPPGPTALRHRAQRHRDT